MKLTYRPEIDGLRAIAVGAVILYHAQITIFGHQPFQGGFIGVDIFFVISGYLITSIILKEIITTGYFSFKYFYERRIRRILPVLLFVMLVSLPFAWMYLLPSSFVDFSRSILYSLGFSSNFYFHYSGQKYGGEGASLKPFLHTWSLSVEEQYYILFPIVLLVTFKYFRKYLIHILLFGFIVSLGLADWGSRNHPSFNFYVLPTRVWELLAGSILAYFEITKGYRSKHQTLNLILPTIGFLLIGHSILSFNDKMFHPSFYTLSPITGVCLIIWFSHKNELITKVLSTKLFVGTGLVSYSLYLWHYPIFAFNRIVEFTEGGVFKKLSLVFLILILSIFSYYFIEKPFRNKNNKFKVIITLITISISVLMIYNFSVNKENRLPSKVPEILRGDLFEEPWNLLKNQKGKNCFQNIEGCNFNVSSNKKVYIIGDSHIASLTFNLKDRIVKRHYQYITSTFSSCLFYPGFNLVDNKTQKIDDNCNEGYFQKLKKTLSNDKNSIVIFGGRLPVYLSNYLFDNEEGGVEALELEWGSKYFSVKKNDTIQNSFKREILELSKNNKIVLIYPIPEVGWNVPRNIFRANKFSKNTDLKYITTSFKVYKERTKSSFELLDSIESNNIYRVYPHTLFCNTTIKDRCITHDDINIFYTDDHHPSTKGAEMINDLIMKEIEKIELKSN
jgi:peptidoglycan/LPS O-acetylase OafA/YrhL